MNETSPNSTSSVRLGILQTGQVPEDMADQHADYNQLFVNLLGEHSFDYRHWAVLNNEFPDSINDADAWLITGSRFGVYEDHAWIPPLEDLIREIHEAGHPMVGVCFGHQIIAQALGGTVEKFSDGWSVGRVEYHLDNDIFGGNSTSDSERTALLAFHQDQIITPPVSAKTVGRTNFCKHAALLYGDKILTVQPHPEFYSKFIGDLLIARADVLPDDIKHGASETLHLPIVREPMAETFRNFLKQDAS